MCETLERARGRRGFVKTLVGAGLSAADEKGRYEI